MVILGRRFGTRVEGWVRFTSVGFETEIRFVGPGSRTWVSLEGTGAGAGVRFKGAGVGTRLGFGSGVEGLAESVKTKVLPTSGVGAEFGLPGTSAVSKVLVRWRVLRVRVSGLLSVGVEGPDMKVVLGSSAGLSMV